MTRVVIVFPSAESTRFSSATDLRIVRQEAHSQINEPAFMNSSFLNACEPACALRNTRTLAPTRVRQIPHDVIQGAIVTGPESVSGTPVTLGSLGVVVKNAPFNPLIFDPAAHVAVASAPVGPITGVKVDAMVTTAAEPFT